MNCGHMVVCEDCFGTVGRNCPICHNNIVNSFRMQTENEEDEKEVQDMTPIDGMRATKLRFSERLNQRRIERSPDAREDDAAVKELLNDIGEDIEEDSEDMMGISPQFRQVIASMDLSSEGEEKDFEE